MLDYEGKARKETLRNRKWCNQN